MSCEKTAEVEALGRDAAILISLALQHGCDFDTMRHAITREETGVASTLIGQLLDEIESIDPSNPLGTEPVPAVAMMAGIVTPIRPLTEPV